MGINCHMGQHSLLLNGSFTLLSAELNYNQHIKCMYLKMLPLKQMSEIKPPSDFHAV
jgi:hypothetical protein